MLQEFLKTISGQSPTPVAVSEAHPAPVGATARACLGTQTIVALSTSVATSLTVPPCAVCAEIQADGGTVRMRRDAVAPTSTTGWRIDEGASVTVDSVLEDVRLLAASTTNVQIVYFDRV